MAFRKNDKYAYYYYDAFERKNTSCFDDRNNNYIGDSTVGDGTVMANKNIYVYVLFILYAMRLTNIARCIMNI